MGKLLRRLLPGVPNIHFFNYAMCVCAPLSHLCLFPSLFPSILCVYVRHFYAIFRGRYQPLLLLTSSFQVFVTPVILIHIPFLDFLNIIFIVMAMSTSMSVMHQSIAFISLNKAGKAWKTPTMILDR